MLALQLVVGVGIALLFPLLIYSSVALFKAPPKPRDFYKPTRPGEEDQLNSQNAALGKARAGHAKILFAVMAPAGLAAVLAIFAAVDEIRESARGIADVAIHWN